MKTTAEDFEEFKRACLYWQEFFGLFDWRINFEWTRLNGNNGEYYFDLEAKQVTIRLNKGKIYCPIEELAKHEVIESILLGKLREMAKVGKSTDEQVEEECHRVVNILEAKFTRGGKK